ncbi:hypothetical protein BGZ94_000335 [Podila epigama]|nr:hypothetical protein BGZ94_000335 [Podila epigama]
MPRTSEGMGVGLFVDPALVEERLHESDTESAKDQGDLLFVPNTCILSRSGILHNACTALRETFEAIGEDNVTERLALVLFLLHERLVLGANSGDTAGDAAEDDALAPPAFAPYIVVLPEISTPVTLDPELVQGYLAGTILLDSVCAKRNKLETEYATLSGNMGVFEHWPVKPTVNDFIWADATVWSRVLSFQSQANQDDNNQEANSSSPLATDDLHMVPYLDFANHANQSNIRWQVDEKGLWVWGNEHLAITNDDSKQVSEQQVFLSYGVKSNTEFLYGFTLEDNPTKQLTLAFPMDEEDPYYMPKAHTLMRHGIPPRITLHLNCTGETTSDLVELCSGIWVNKESLYLLWIYALNEEDGLGALMEEPVSKICIPNESNVTQGEEDGEGQDASDEVVDLDDEDVVGRLVMTILDKAILSKDALSSVVPTLEIYPVLMLRALVLVTSRVEYYIERIMATGDRVQKVEHGEIVKTVHYEQVDVIESLKSPSIAQPEKDKEEDLKLGPHVMSLVAMMKNYRNEEMAMLVRISDLLGEGQTKTLEESEFIQEYLAKMQLQDE